MKSINKQLITASVVAIFVSMSAAVKADDAAATTTSPATKKEISKEVGSGPNPFSDCGIGAAIFVETKWAAVTSNVIWDIGTTALTSATASPQTCSGKKLQAALFINQTYANLAEETASGKGEHLTAVLNIFGCDSARHANAIQQLRSEMGRAVSAPNYIDQSHIDKASGYYSIVEQSVSASCSV